MHVGVGYSDNPDTAAGGTQAASEALARADRSNPCDLVLLFATARHDPRVLRDAVVGVVGPSARIVGGGAVGAVTNDAYGYGGDQIGLALFWFDGGRVDLASEGRLVRGEKQAGRLLGKKLAALGTSPEDTVLLFYDAIDRTHNDLRMVTATYLLEGIREGLGFLPDFVGTGLLGDHNCTPYKQWTGASINEHHALALKFSGGMRCDSVVMHGCMPAAGYYTVTRADRQTILEIEGRPALDFMDSLFGHAIAPENFPFFLIFGVNSGEKWAEFDELAYANRLCLAIDKKRKGIVMFEPDMVAGTQFQIMYRSLDLDYIPPRIEQLFTDLDGRKPVFALYINCAGRAAGNAGLDEEDVTMVQKSVAGRVPLLGLYSGVEIASIKGCPRGLDWTGVFCLFSVP